MTEGEIQDSINIVILSYRSVKQEPYQYYADLDLVLSLLIWDNSQNKPKIMLMDSKFFEVALKFIIIIRETRSIFFWLCAYSLADAFAEVGFLSSTSFLQPFSIQVLFFIGFLGLIKRGAMMMVKWCIVSKMNV